MVWMPLYAGNDGWDCGWLGVGVATDAGTALGAIGGAVKVAKGCLNNASHDPIALNGATYGLPVNGLM